MERIAVRRQFEVPVPPDVAWRCLAEVERWPEWAPHIRSVTVEPPGSLGPTSSGVLSIRGFGRNAFAMSAWEPPQRWEWVGDRAGLRVHYDHRFVATGADTARLEWVVRLSGPLAPLIRPVFTALYSRKVDRAIPSLQAWMSAQANHQP